MYSIEFSDKAKKQILKLSLEIQNRIGNSIERIKIRPYHFVKRLVGSNYYSLRVGNYRIILDILNKELIIIVLEMGHRKNIYKE